MVELYRHLLCADHELSGVSWIFTFYDLKFMIDGMSHPRSYNNGKSQLQE